MRAIILEHVTPFGNIRHSLINASDGSTVIKNWRSGLPAIYSENPRLVTVELTPTKLPNGRQGYAIHARSGLCLGTIQKNGKQVIPCVTIPPINTPTLLPNIRSTSM